MNGQLEAILEILLSNENYVTYETLAARLNVSSRTVMRLLKNAEGPLSDFSIVVEVKRRSGIRLAGTSENLERLREALSLEKTADYTAKERLLLILLELFQAEEPVKAYYLAYLLNVSVGTVNRDLEETGKRLEKSGLKLLSQRGSGWRVLGSRHAARQMLAGLFRRYVDMRSWNTDEKSPVFRTQMSARVRRRLLELMDLPGLYRTLLLLQAFDYTTEENFVQEDFQKYVIYTHITLHFPWLSRNFPKEKRNLELKEHVLYPRMCELARKVKKEEEILLQEEDICDLLAVYLSMRSSESLFTVYKYDEEVRQMTLELLEDIETELQRKLTTDEQLVERLSAHLNLMFDRLHLGAVADHTDLDQLKEEYPRIFEIVERKVAVFALRNHVDISESETGYIIIHILASILEQESEKQKIRAAVLCMSGIGTSQMLAQRLKNRISGLEIMAKCSLADFREEELVRKGIDLVISTIGIETLTARVFLIDPIPSEEDFAKLEGLCQEITEKKLKASFAGIRREEKREDVYRIEKAMFRVSCMEQILESFSCEKIWANTLSELYESVAARMFEEGQVREEFADLLKKRESQGSILFHDNGMILLHGRIGSGPCLKVFSVIGEPEYLEDGRMVPIRHAVAMTAPEEAKEECLGLFSCISAALVQEPELICAIEGEDEEMIFQIFGRLMSREIFG